MNKNYPSAPPSCFSLARFSSLYKIGALPAVLQVAGPLVNSSIASQNVEMTFTDLDSSSISNGDHVLIEFELSRVRAISKDRFQVEGARTQEVLLRSKDALLSSEFDGERAQQWSGFLDTVRGFLRGRSLIEVTTPSLVKNPGMEPHLQPFTTEWVWGSKREAFFLPTSPELHLKQLLARGLTDIFEIKTCFRNEEQSPLHEPEFQMLEWYRAYSGLDWILRDLIGLLATFDDRIGHSVPVQILSLSEIFQTKWQFDLRPETSRNQLESLCRQLSVETLPDDSWDDLFHRLLIEKIEPGFDPDVPTILRDYPPSQAALARINSKGWADRFELYWKGMEIANAFHELNDPIEQRQRFIRDQAERRRLKRTPLAIDENFMQALEAGMPPSAGIALGLDRLFMAVFGIEKIENSRAFSIRHALKRN